MPHILKLFNLLWNAATLTPFITWGTYRGWGGSCRRPGRRIIILDEELDTCLAGGSDRDSGYDGIGLEELLNLKVITIPTARPIPIICTSSTSSQGSLAEGGTLGHWNNGFGNSNCSSSSSLTCCGSLIGSDLTSADASLGIPTNSYILQMWSKRFIYYSNSNLVFFESYIVLWNFYFHQAFEKSRLHWRRSGIALPMVTISFADP